MLWEVRMFLQYDWISFYWIDPPLHFTYKGFGWVRPWPGAWMIVHFYALGVLSILVALGLWYRLAAILLTLGFTYVFLLEQAQYLNHFYLMCLISFLLIFVPAHRSFSLDAARSPSLRSDSAPAWGLWLLRAQIGLVYFFGGVAKLKSDWLNGQPMRLWLEDVADLPLIGPLLAREWAVWVTSYGGLLLDLLIVPLLLWRRTRAAAFGLAVLFHLANAAIFPIGIFPWLMIGATTLFLAPSWPRRLLGPEPVERETTPRALPAGTATVAVLLGLYMIPQVALPLRHYLYPGDVLWTEEGQMFAWHMRLRDKWAIGRFILTDSETGASHVVAPHDLLPAWQANRMLITPDMILQFSHHLAESWREEGHRRVEVRAEIEASLIGRPLVRLIDPEVDLASQPRDLGPAPWIEPLTLPLEGPAGRDDGT